MWTILSILSQTDSSTACCLLCRCSLQGHKCMGEPRTLQRAGGDTDTEDSSAQPPLPAGTGPQHHLPLLFPAGTGCASRAAGTSILGAKLCPALHSQSCTPELRQLMSCLESSEPFNMFLPFSIPCTIFDLKNFLCNLKSRKVTLNP